MSNKPIAELLFSTLQFTNSPTMEDVVLEDCGDYDSRLDGYSIVLNRGKFPAMEIFLKETFPKYKDVISASFSSDDNLNDKVTQCCYTYYPDKFTEKFVERFEGVDNLIKYGPAGVETFSSVQGSDGNLEEGEDPEMIKELEEKVKELESKIKEQDEKIEYYESKYPEGDLDDEVLTMFMDILEGEDPSVTKDAIYQAIMENVEAEDEREVTRIIGIVLDQYDKMGVIDRFFEMGSDSDE